MASRKSRKLRNRRKSRRNKKYIGGGLTPEDRMVLKQIWNNLKEKLKTTDPEKYVNSALITDPGDTGETIDLYIDAKAIILYEIRLIELRNSNNLKENKDIQTLPLVDKNYLKLNKLDKEDRGILIGIYSKLNNEINDISGYDTKELYIQDTIMNSIL